MRALLTAIALTLATPVLGADYQPPESCTPLATLRHAGCAVSHVSHCEEGNIEDRFENGVFAGRSVYSHPSLFVRFEGADGFVVGHAYGDGAPGPGTDLLEGEVYTYSRRVVRSAGDPEAGDEGIEVMEIGPRVELTLDGRPLPVRDIRFHVTNEETGYDYRERALLLIDPPISLGALGVVRGPDGEEEFSTLPESISLAGEAGFLSMRPGPSCGPRT